jgi:steroid delta-isomerase-like uncharacterized protein
MGQGSEKKLMDVREAQAKRRSPLLFVANTSSEVFGLKSAATLAELGLLRRGKEAMSFELNNRAIVRRFVEESWKGNFEVVDELADRDYVGHDPANPEPVRGPEGVKKFISTYRAAFPDAQVTVEEQLANGDLVATRWTSSGTRHGKLMGVDPTGKRVTVTGVTITRLARGKLVEEFHNWDAFGLIEELNAIPLAAPA